MRAKLIYNQSLYSSAQGIFELVKSNLENTARHVIIVPERYTLISEKQLLKTLGKNCSFECEVVSINRLCNRVFGIGEVLDRQGGVILVQKILEEKKKELKFFKAMQTKLGFALNVYETLMQFKSSGVKPQEVALNLKNSLLASKMQDLALIYSEYEKYIEQGYTDGIAKLTELRNEVKTNDFFNSCSFYFAYFEAFTFNDLAFVKELIKHNNPTFVGCRYALGQANEHIFTNSIYEQISSLFLELGLNDISEYNDILPNTREYLKNNLFAYNAKPLVVDNAHIYLQACKNSSSEISSVLKRIYYLVAHLGYRYKDINVAIGSLDGYKDSLIRELANYNFNYYIDSSITLRQTELGRFVLGVLEAVEYNFMQADTFALLNNYYFNVESNQKDFLNAVITKFKLQGISYLINFSLIENDEYLLSLAQELNVDYAIVLQDFYNKLKFVQDKLKCSTCYEYIDAIKEIFAFFNVNESHSRLLQENIYDLSSYKVLEQVIEKLDKIFNQIQELGFNVKYSLINFAKLIAEGLEACKVNLVPLSVDAIYFGDAQASTFDRRKIMIIMGANYGIFPSVTQDVGLISDREVDALAIKYVLEPKVSDVNMRSRLKAYELCLLSSQELFVYYAQSTDGGEELHPSTVIQSLQNCFEDKDGEKLKIVDSLVEKIKFEDGKEKEAMLLSGNKQSAKTFVLEHLENAQSNNFASIYSALSDVSNITDLMSINKKDFAKQNLVDLYKYAFKTNGKKSKFSITQLGTYFDCPYRHFVERGLKIKELLGANLNQLDIGTILHSFAEKFALCLIDNKTYYSDDKLAKIKEKITNEIVCENSYKFSLDVNEVVAKRLIQEGNALMDKINSNYKKSEFKVDCCEYYFDNYLFYKGKNDYILNGRIDRIDKYSNCAVLLDYKTGNAKAELKDVYYGKKLQLILYANALKNMQKDLHISGFGYFPIHDKYVKDDSVDVIDGFFEENDDIITKLDSSLSSVCIGEKITSKIYNFYKQITKTDKNIKYGNKVLEANVYNNLFVYADLVAKQALKEIEAGYIEAKPLRTGEKCSCDFCPYSCICNHELNIQERVEDSVDNKFIEEAIKNVQTNG